MATKWTPEQDQIVFEEVQKNPENLREAFFIASLKINKTPAAVCTRYYAKESTGESQIQKLSRELIAMYEANLKLKGELRKCKN